jgi:hypothetical protein
VCPKAAYGDNLGIEQCLSECKQDIIAGVMKCHVQVSKKCVSAADNRAIDMDD